MAAREPDLLRLVTCGSVDDGKSTLIGRLLAETGAVPEDLLLALDADSRRHGTCGEATDYALLVDGLAAEREQGITIDVAYRYFGTARRRFIVADSPGHVQYTRNMATAASTADLAVLLVDAEKGLLAQTRRHALIVALLGIRQVVLAVNKMDRVGWSESRFAAIAAEFGDFAKDLDLAVTAIPLCARSGDNLVAASTASPWYTGPDLLGFLESVPLPSPADGPLRLPVQWVCRPDQSFRGYAGPVLGGSVRAGDRVRLLPSGVVTRVERLVDMAGDRALAVRGESVMLTLADEVELGRGDMLCAADDPAEVADQFEADLIWFDESPMLPGRPYVVKLATASAGASFATLKHRLDTDTRELLAARTLEMNEIGTATLMLDRPLPFDPYAANRDTGSFIVIDRYSQRTVGAGMLRFALRRAHNIHWQPMAVDKAARSHQAGHRPCVIWLTGLSGSGKSTIADAVERELHARGIRTYVLDGDNIRHGLCRDLGFTEADRVENIRRVGEVARLMVDAGLVVITAFISPFRSERQLARSLVGADEFLEIFVDVPLEVAEARDPKGLYARARRGELPNFTGIDSPYEPPLEPDLQLPTDRIDTGEAARRILELLRSRGITGAGSQRGHACSW